MKKTTLLLSLLAIIFSASAQIGKAIKSVESGKVTQETINIFKKEAEKKGSKLSSNYYLGKIYHYNSTYQNYTQAKFHYKTYIENYSLYPNKNLPSKYEVENLLTDLDRLIDKKNFYEYVSTNTLDGYAEFVKAYPSSNYLTEAKDKAFEKVVSVNTMQAYKKYLSYFSHRTSEIKDKAFKIINDKNKEFSYSSLKTMMDNEEIKEVVLKNFTENKEYLNDFSNWKSDELYESAFEIAKQANNIETFNLYAATFPNSAKSQDAKSFRDLILVNDFIATIKNKDIKGKITESNKFLANNTYNAKKNDLIDYLKKNLPILSNEASFRKAYTDICLIPITNSELKQLIDNYFTSGVFDVYEIKTDYKDAYESCGSSPSACKSTFNSRIASYKSIIANYPSLPSSARTSIQDKLNNDEFYITYQEVKYIISNEDSYSAAQHKANALNAYKIINNRQYQSCDEYSTAKSFIENKQVSYSCAKCSGTGQAAQQVDCNPCRGKGEIRCNNSVPYVIRGSSGFFGFGAEPDKHYTAVCMGGYLTNENPYHHEICTVCNGSGIRRCEKCDGWGKIKDCPQCNGSGTFTTSYLSYYR